jgi:hypothetical protein
MFNWDPQSRTAAAANGDGDTSKLLVATSRVAGSNGLDRAISGQWDGESVCDGGSPHRGASRGHRNEPFFIGVAGGTASGECSVYWPQPGLRRCGHATCCSHPLSTPLCCAVQARRQSVIRSSSGCTVRRVPAHAGRLPLSAAACMPAPSPVSLPNLCSRAACAPCRPVRGHA